MTSAIPSSPVLLTVWDVTQDLKQFGMPSQCMKDNLGQSPEFTQDFAGVDKSIYVVIGLCYYSIMWPILSHRVCEISK